jgi:hypothetical protein
MCGEMAGRDKLATFYSCNFVNDAAASGSGAQ